jgi:hypothetical protein
MQTLASQHPKSFQSKSTIRDLSLTSNPNLLQPRLANQVRPPRFILAFSRKKSMFKLRGQADTARKPVSILVIQLLFKYNSLITMGSLSKQLHLNLALEKLASDRAKNPAIEAFHKTKLTAS